MLLLHHGLLRHLDELHQLLLSLKEVSEQKLYEANLASKRSFQ